MTPLPPDIAATIDALVDLRPRRKSSPPIRKLVPAPLATLEDWQRFTHEDIAAMEPATRRAESFRLKVAIALVDADQVPAYLLQRIARLDAA